MLIDDLREERPHLRIIGLLDDDPTKQGQIIHGVPVIGTLKETARITAELQPSELIIAIPSLDREGQRRVLEFVKSVTVPVRMMPSISRQLARLGEDLPFLRDVAPEELLRRDSIETDLSDAAPSIRGKCVLITGGGGSIGSEIARQVATLKPDRLILVGKGENSIFEAAQDLRERGFQACEGLIADVRDQDTVERIFRHTNPEVIFHAAAHKHVPLMEHAPIEAVRNNVLGTRSAALAAIEAGTQRFILVSTDKAVNPTNIMGATKRVAELIVLALHGISSTKFSAVRFGNVLGSRGSLVPILKRQIRRGGPLTLTDPRMTRFFMTIPEAAQLVIQAGAKGEGGDLFLLDMGEPVKIIDVARELLELHGLREGQDIEIKFIGARPGEKIHEELSWEDEGLERLNGSKLLRLRAPGRPDWTKLSRQIDALDELCEQGEESALRERLMALATTVFTDS